MASNNTHQGHYTTFSTDQTLFSDTPTARSTAPTNSTSSTLNEPRDYFNLLNTAPNPSTSSTKQRSSPKEEQDSKEETPFKPDDGEKLHPYPSFPTNTSKYESSYDPAEFEYSTPPGQHRTVSHRIKKFFKAFHIVRHWPKYEKKLERKLLYLYEDAAYWRGEVEERERLQEERLERQRKLMEEKNKREREMWGLNGGLNAETLGCSEKAFGGFEPLPDPPFVGVF